MLALPKRVLGSSLDPYRTPLSVVLMHAFGFKRLGKAASPDPNLRGRAPGWGLVFFVETGYFVAPPLGEVGQPIS